MTNSGVEVPETGAVAEPAQPQPKKKTAVNRAGNQRAESLKAKKKQRRAAHRVALRRSNTGG
jgi:hypothetical protein